MKSTVTLGLLIVALVCVGCGDRQPAMLSPAEKDSLAKLSTGSHELIAKEDLAGLRNALAVLRNTGRFQMIPLGVRTWRLDTVTGQSCLLLTSDQDWKDETVKAQSCGLLPLVK
jgi:hypothetical protein